MTAKKKPKPKPLVENRELRALVELHHNPDDIHVYADWLEEQGDLERASYLRKQLQLGALAISHRKLLDRGRELHALGEALPADWVAAMSPIDLTDTAWDGRDNEGSLVLRFRSTGFVNYSQSNGTYENGRWKQIGITLAYETNAHYADYFGVIVADTMRGAAHNINNFKWSWKVKRTEDPAVVAVPDDTNRTIHDDHVRRAPAKPKRQAPSKPKRTPKPKQPLTRKTPLKRKAKRA